MSRPWSRRVRRVAWAFALLALAAVGTTLWLDARAERRFAARVQQGPFSERFVDADGVRLRYLEAGSGPALVLLHGAYGGAEDWAATVGPELAARFRVLAFDRPGHGFSGRAGGRRHADPVGQARAVAAALDALGVERPLLAGFSWGGAAAAALVTELPGRAAGAVLIAAPLHPWDGDPALVDRLLAVPVVGPAVAHIGASLTARALAPALLEEAFAPEEPPSSYLERSPVALALRADALVANAIDMAGLNRALAALSPRYDRIAVPIEVVHGAEDQVVWASHHAQPFADARAGAELTLVGGAGHQLPWTRPTAVVDAIDRLARRTAESADARTAR